MSKGSSYNTIWQVLLQSCVQVMWDPGEGILTDKGRLYIGVGIWAGYQELSEIYNIEKRLHERMNEWIQCIQGLVEMWFDVAEKWGEWKVKVRDKEWARSNHRILTYRAKGVKLYPGKTESHWSVLSRNMIRSHLCFRKIVHTVGERLYGKKEIRGQKGR